MQGFPNYHMTILLGLPAIILLGIGALLYEISREKYTRHHGICAGLSILLTTINIIGIIPTTIIVLTGTWFDLFHIAHILIGIVGYIFGVVAFITGISGIRTKIPGYIALISWTTVFVMGYVQYLL